MLLECLDNAAVEQVSSVSRRPCCVTHAKLRECLVTDFRDLRAVENQLVGFDACFYCAGVSSVGMSEADYTAITYDTPLHLAETLLRLNPQMVLTHISGAHTDGTEQGKVMWARVKGKAENALMRLAFKGVYNFRISPTKPAPGQRRVKGGYYLVMAIYPILELFFPGISLRDVGRAMINGVLYGAPKQVLEVPDLRQLAQR